MLIGLQRALRRGLNLLGYDLVRVPRRHRPGRRRGVVYYETPIGNYYLPAEAPDDIIAFQMRRGRVFEPEVVEVARRFIRPGSAVIDVGANYGQMSLIFAGLTGPEGRVYAIEAHKRVHDILAMNVEANGADNIVSIFGPAHFESGRTFHFPQELLEGVRSYGASFIPLRGTTGCPVESLRIDDFAIDRPVSFMKVDVQGFDLFAMRGAVEAIARYRMPILFEFEQPLQQEYGTRFQDHADFVRSIGYEFTETVLKNNYLIEPAR